MRSICGQTRSTINACLCALVIALVMGCEETPKTQRWIGAYMYPGYSEKFPIYLDITITGGRVSGRSFDGNMEEATVSGSVEGAAYSLLLHPLKQGASTEQDVHFRGMRSNDSIVGEWEHVVGAKGKWTASLTDLAPNEALRLYIPPCEQASRKKC